MIYARYPKCLKCGYEKSPVRSADGRFLCPKCDDFPEGILRYDYAIDGTKYRLEFSKKAGYYIRTNFMMFRCRSYLQARLLFYVLGFFPVKQWVEVAKLTKKMERLVYNRNIRWSWHDFYTFAETVLREVEKRLSIHNG